MAYNVYIGGVLAVNNNGTYNVDSATPGAPTGYCPLWSEGPEWGDYTPHSLLMVWNPAPEVQSYVYYYSSGYWTTDFVGAPVSVTLEEILTAPDVVGMNQDVARDAIESASLIVGDITTEYDETEVDIVIEQDPIAGAAVSLGSHIDLVVSLGMPPKAINPVPGNNTVGISRSLGQISWN